MPKTISSTLVPVGGIALFFVLASWISLSNPRDSSRKFGAFLYDNQSAVLIQKDNPLEDVKRDVISEKITPASGKLDGFHMTSSSPFGTTEVVDFASVPIKNKGGETNQGVQVSEPAGKSTSAIHAGPVVEPVGDNGNVESISMRKPTPALGLSDQTGSVESGDGGTINMTVNSSIVKPSPASDLSNSQGKYESGSCDLYRGKWFYDPLGPLYTNSSCPIITQMQNCQGNGRPDKEYENWRWKPSQCDLPRFDAKIFLELMRGKTLAFIGDSVARNQMESLLCILWQVETPENRGSRRRQRWLFQSFSVTIVRIWSSWLVHKSPEAFQDAAEGIDKIFLDAPDEDFMDFLPKCDVVVLSSGHWFTKQSVYILNNEIVGGQLWWPYQSREMKFNNVEAFGAAMETSLTAIVTHPDYKGLTIVRSFSPDHYEGGAWNTGGSCTGKVEPAAEGQVVKNEFTEAMYSKQVAGFKTALKRATNKSKLKLMDVTRSFGLRHDGHPGPYRSTDPKKKTKRGPNGEPPPQDCLHWCMPGPVDTWNEFVLETIKREFGARQDL